MTNAIAKTHIDATVTFNGQTHTFSQACDHVAHMFDKRDDTAELVLLQTRDIGEWLLTLQPRGEAPKLILLRKAPS